jgi:hypothetical protein
MLAASIALAMLAPSLRWDEPAMRLAVLVPKLGERIGERLEVAVPLQDEVVLLRCTSANPDDVLARLARLHLAKWETEPGLRRLVPDREAMAAAAKRERAERIAALEAELQKLRTQVEAPFSAESADRLARDLAGLKGKSETTEEAVAKRAKRRTLERQLPHIRFATNALLSIGAAKLVDHPKASYSWPVSAWSRPIPGIEDHMARMAREEDLWETASAFSQSEANTFRSKHPPSAHVSIDLRWDVGYAFAFLNSPGRRPYGWIETLNYGPGTIPEALVHEPVRLPSLERFASQVRTSYFRPKLNHRPEEIYRTFLDPRNHDPLQTDAQYIASAFRGDLLLCVPDAAIGMSFGSSVSRAALLNSLRRLRLLIEQDGPWTTISPQWMLMHRAQRAPRSDLASLWRPFAATVPPDVRQLCRASKHLISLRVLGFLMVDDPSDYHIPGAEAIGAFTDAEFRNLEAGRAITWANLNLAARKALFEVLERSILDSAIEDEEEKYAAFVWQLFPAGVPPDAQLRLRVTTAEALIRVFAVPNAPVSFRVDGAMSVDLDDKGKPKIDWSLYRMGLRRTYVLRVELAPGQSVSFMADALELAPPGTQPSAAFLHDLTESIKNRSNEVIDE